MDINYLLATEEGWTLRAKLRAGFNTSPRQTPVDFIVDTGCLSFDVSSMRRFKEGVTTEQTAQCR